MTARTSQNNALLGIGIVLLHLLVVVPHGFAHSKLQILMNQWQNLYILIVINLLPLLAAFLIWIRPRAGYLLLLISMTGSLLFGVYYHFIAPGADNAATLPEHAWTHTFQWTAVLLAITELIGIAIGFTGLRGTKRVSLGNS
jgi:hypothetical protein